MTGVHYSHRLRTHSFREPAIGQRPRFDLRDLREPNSHNPTLTARGQHPNITVVMGVHNAAPALPECLGSLLSQDAPSYEVVVIDDGSTDATGQVLQGFSRVDPRLRVIARPRSGLTRSLILGCSIARGGIIVRQDADDVSAPGRLSSLAAAFEDDTTVLAFSWVRYVDANGHLLGAYDESLEAAERTRRLREEMVGVPAHGSVAFRRAAYEACGGYREEFYYAQDNDLWLRMATLGSITCVEQHLYDCRLHVDSISSIHRGLQKSLSELARACHQQRLIGSPEGEGKLLAQARAIGDLAMRSRDQRPSRPARALTHLLIAGTLASAGRPKDALRAYASGLLSWPFSARIWLALLRSTLALAVPASSRRVTPHDTTKPR